MKKKIKGNGKDPLKKEEKKPELEKARETLQKLEQEQMVKYREELDGWLKERGLALIPVVAVRGSVVMSSQVNIVRRPG